MIFNREQIAGWIRILVTLLLAKNLIPSEFASDSFVNAVAQVIEAVGILGLLFWSWYDHRKEKQIANVAKMDDVKKVVAHPEIANEGELASNPKVVADD